MTSRPAAHHLVAALIVLMPGLLFFTVQDLGGWLATFVIKLSGLSNFWSGRPDPVDFAQPLGRILGPVSTLFIVGLLYRWRLASKLAVASASVAIVAAGGVLLVHQWSYLADAWPRGAPMTIKTLWAWSETAERRIWPPYPMAACLAFLSAGFGWRIFTRAPRAFIERTSARLERDSAGLHRADWMSMRAARKLFSAKAGVVIGEGYRRDLEPTGVARLLSPPRGGSAPLLRLLPRGHLLTVGGAGSGKSTSYAIPSLLDWPYPVVVLDPSYELFQATSAHRAEHLGRRVLKLDPTSEETSGFNALGWLDPAGTTLPQDVKQIAAWFSGQRSTQRNTDMFELTGHAIVRTLLLHLVHSSPHGSATLERLVELVSQSESDLRDYLNTVGKTDSPAAKAARRLGSVSAPETFSGMVANAIAEVDFLDNPNYHPIISSVAGPRSFEVDDLLNGDTDLFINIPLATIRQDPGLARIILGSILSAVMRRNRALDRPLLLLLDEMPRLEYMEILETALVAMRKFNVILWPLVQDLGQLEIAYGPQGVRSWTDSCYVTMYVGIQDERTCEFLSSACGSYSVKQSSHSETEAEAARAGRAAGSNSYQQSLRSEKRRLIEPDEVRRMAVDGEGRADEQIILMRGQPPLRCGLAKYFRRSDMRSLASVTDFVNRQ